MDLTLAIKHLYPTFTDEDFIVMNDNQGQGDYIVWYNTEITQPSQAEGKFIINCDVVPDLFCTHHNT